MCKSRTVGVAWRLLHVHAGICILERQLPWPLCMILLCNLSPVGVWTTLIPLNVQIVRPTQAHVVSVSQSHVFGLGHCGVRGA